MPATIIEKNKFELRLRRAVHHMLGTGTASWLVSVLLSRVSRFRYARSFVYWFCPCGAIVYHTSRCMLHLFFPCTVSATPSLGNARCHVRSFLGATLEFFFTRNSAHAVFQRISISRAQIATKTSEIFIFEH